MSLSPNLSSESDILQFVERAKTRVLDYWIGVGYVAETRGDLEVALEYYRTAVNIDRSSYVAHFNAANVLLKSGRFKQAIESYDRALAV